MENTTVKKAIIMLSYDRDGDRFEDVIRFMGEPITDRELAIKIAYDSIEQESSCESVDLVEFEGETEEDFYAIEWRGDGYTPFYSVSFIRCSQYDYKQKEERA